MAESHEILEQLLAYAAGELSDAEASTMEKRISGDQSIAAMFRTLLSVRSAIANDAANQPSERALARALAVFAKPVSQPRLSWMQAVEQFIANLLFDSRLQPAGMRSAGAGIAPDRIELSYESQVASIDLQADRVSQPSPHPSFAKASDLWRLRGQVWLQGSPAGTRMAIENLDSQELRELTVDEHGGFVLEIPSGRYSLYVQVPNGAMVLPEIDFE